MVKYAFNMAVPVWRPRLTEEKECDECANMKMRLRG